MIFLLLVMYPSSVPPQTSISENAIQKMPNDFPLKQLGLVLSYRAAASSFDARRGRSNLALEKGHLGKDAVRKYNAREGRVHFEPNRSVNTPMARIRVRARVRIRGAVRAGTYPKGLEKRCGVQFLMWP